MDSSSTKQWQHVRADVIPLACLISRRSLVGQRYAVNIYQVTVEFGGGAHTG
jgi:hypothetical protein